MFPEKRRALAEEERVRLPESKHHNDRLRTRMHRPYRSSRNPAPQNLFRVLGASLPHGACPRSRVDDNDHALMLFDGERQIGSRKLFFRETRPAGMSDG